MYILTWYEEEAVPKRKLVGNGGERSNAFESSNISRNRVVNDNNMEIPISCLASIMQWLCYVLII